MYGEKYIVLRSKGAAVPTFDNLGTRGGPVIGPAPAAETIEIEAVDLTPADRKDLRRDPQTRAIAPPMPMILIEPVESSSASDASNDAAVTWGIQAVGATGSPFDGSGITVAVLDTGIDPAHPAFEGTTLVRRNFTEEGEDDINGHGTHCAGTIFGKDVDGTRIGLARNVDKALIGKVLGDGGGSSAILAEAIQWAVNQGAHVVSMSLGIDFPGFVKWVVDVHSLDERPATSMALEAYRANVNLFTQLARMVEAQGMFGQGTVIVAASGNESNRPSYEIAVAPPAAGTGIISVGALEQSAQGLSVAYFSNNQVDISAPGARVLSAVPGGGLGLKSGTSMATPHAAGVAALWAQRQLETAGRVNNQILMAQLIASGTFEPLLSGVEAEDAGSGIVQAPLL